MVDIEDIAKMMKLIRKPSDVPDGPHFAIIIYGSIHHDDGYGGMTNTDTAEHHVTMDRDEWVREIERLEKLKGYDRQVYVALEIKGKAVVETRVVVL